MSEARRIQRALETFIEQKVVIPLVQNVARHVAAATPVKTRHAQSNWIITTGAPYPGVAGSPDSVDFSVQTKGLAGILRYRLSMGNVFITNNVDYIVELSEGSSAQAPKGFVQAAIIRGILDTTS